MRGEGIDGARRRKNQTCMKFDNMLAQQDWVAVRKATTRYGRVAVLGTRAYLINMDNPSEPTLHHMAKILALIENAESWIHDEVFVRGRSPRCQPRFRVRQGGPPRGGRARARWIAAGQQAAGRADQRYRTFFGPSVVGERP